MVLSIIHTQHIHKHVRHCCCYCCCRQCCLGCCCCCRSILQLHTYARLLSSVYIPIKIQHSTVVHSIWLRLCCACLRARTGFSSPFSRVRSTSLAQSIVLFISISSSVDGHQSRIHTFNSSSVYNDIVRMIAVFIWYFFQIEWFCFIFLFYLPWLF